MLVWAKAVRSIAFAAVAVVLAAIGTAVWTPSSAASSYSSSGPVSATSADAEDDWTLAAAAAAFASEKGITVAEASRRLELMGPLVSLSDRVRALVPGDRLGGVYIDQDSGSLVVRLTEGAIPVGLEALASTSRLEIRTDATVSHQDRVDVVDEHAADWMAAISSVDGVYAPERSDEIVLRVTDPKAAGLVAGLEPQAAADKLNRQHTELDAEGLDLVIDPTTPGSDDNKGGRDLRTCTSAFAVKSGTSPALLTAGHCPLPQPWYYFNGQGPYDTVFNGSVYNTYADMQWLIPIEGADVKPYYFGPNTTDPGVPQKANVANVEGDWVCHRGKQTGYSCGGIASIHYKPTYAGACPGGECESRFVLATGNNLESAGGDSGGPWFRGALLAEPVGVHKGSNGAHDLWYSKLGNLPSSVSIWVHPDA